VSYLGFDGRIHSGQLMIDGLFKAHGWTWGGDWASAKDYQHFEKVLKE
jgi:hypothetical protein